jgi:hypothetical protein
MGWKAGASVVVAISLAGFLLSQAAWAAIDAPKDFGSAEQGSDSASGSDDGGPSIDLPPKPTFEVTVPTIEATDSNVDEATLRSILSGDIAAHADQVAHLTAKSIRIPDLRLHSSVLTGEGQVTESEIVYRDIEFRDVVDGVAASTAVGGAEMTGGADVTMKIGRISTGLFDMGAALAMYRLVPAPSETELRPIYRDFAIESVTFTGPNVACAVGPISMAEFRARPLKYAFGDLLALMGTMQTAKDSPPPEAVSKFVAFYADLFQAFETSPATISSFECAGKDETGKSANFRLGPLTVGAFAKARYPDVTVQNIEISAEDAQVDVASFTLKGIDLAGPIAAVQSASGPIDEDWVRENGRQLMPAFGGFALSGLSVDGPDATDPSKRVKASVADFDLTLGDYVDGIPTRISSSAHHVAAPLPADSENAAVQQLLALGIDHVDAGYELSGQWDEAANRIVVDRLMLTGVDLGTLSAAATLGNATRDLFSQDETVSMAAATGLTIKNLKLDLENDGLADRLFTLSAAQQGKDLTAYRTAISGFAQGSILGVLGGTDQAKKLAEAVGSFISGAKSLSISITAKDEAGIGLPDLTSVQEDPTALSEKITVDGSAK